MHVNSWYKLVISIVTRGKPTVDKVFVCFFVCLLVVLFLMISSSLPNVFLASSELIVLSCAHRLLRRILFHLFRLVEKFCLYLGIHQQTQLSITWMFSPLLQELLAFLFRGDPR